MSDAIHVCKPEALPGILGVIAKASSVDTAFKIARALSGSRLYLPKSSDGIHEDHFLSEVIGLDEARRLIEAIGNEWGGSRYDVPSLKAFKRMLEVERLCRQGKTVSEVAAALGIGHSYAGNIVRQFKAIDAARAARLARATKAA